MADLGSDGQAVKPDAASCGSTGRAGHRDVNRCRLRGEEAPELRRAAVTQHGAPAVGEHRREPAPLEAQCLVTHCIDAAMDTVQPSRADATPDPAFVGAGPTQLIGRHHAVLPRRHSRCCTIRPLDEFLSHTENKSSRAVRAQNSPRTN
jgi:hypothetical protein